MNESSTKRCPAHGHQGDRELPLSEFNRNRARADGLHWECRACDNARKRQLHSVNRERDNARRRQYRVDHHDEQIAYSRQWSADNPDYARQYQAQTARLVYSRYGPGGRPECWCCGATERLSIDHIHGGGNAHRLELFGAAVGSYKFYLWLIREGFPLGYQTLCLACNVSKAEGERCTLWHAASSMELIRRWTMADS